MNKWLFPENHAKLNLKPFDESGRPNQLMAGLLQTHILLSNISYLSSILTLTSCFFGPAIAQIRSSPQCQLTMNEQIKKCPEASRSRMKSTTFNMHRWERSVRLNLSHSFVRGLHGLLCVTKRCVCVYLVTCKVTQQLRAEYKVPLWPQGGAKITCTSEFPCSGEGSESRGQQCLAEHRW